VPALWRYAAILVVAAGVSRVPQLTSPHLLLDGDEAILGLMAKHLAEGRDAPIFFYGQAYGLSFFEVAAGAVAFRLAGVGHVQLKLAMLAMWLVGVIAMFTALARLMGPRRALWASLVFALLPAWAVWSMKARGGYLTAFAATALLWNVLVSLRERPSAASWSLAGAFTALIFLAQRLWLPGVLPMVGWLLARQRRLEFGLWYAAGIAAVFAAVIAMTGASLQMLIDAPRGRSADLWRSLPFFLQQVYTHLTGSYYLWTAIDPGPLTALIAWLWYGLLVALMIVQAWRIVFRRVLPMSHVLCLSVLATLIATWVLVSAPEPRFLLPVGALLVAWVAVEAVNLAPRLRVPDWSRAAVGGSLIALGALSQVEFANYAYLWNRPDDGVSERDRLQRAIDYLDSHRVRHVFSTNGLLQWQVMFYSGEAITARYTSESDRYPSFVADVDRALAAGEAVAVMGYARPMRDVVQSAGDHDALAIDDRYFVRLGADKDLLSSLGLRFLADRRPEVLP
jgi:hypothetical protein